MAFIPINCVSTLVWTTHLPESEQESSNGWLWHCRKTEKAFFLKKHNNNNNNSNNINMVPKQGYFSVKWSFLFPGGNFFRSKLKQGYFSGRSSSFLHPRADDGQYTHHFLLQLEKVVFCMSLYEFIHSEMITSFFFRQVNRPLTWSGSWGFWTVKSDVREMIKYWWGSLIASSKLSIKKALCHGKI